MADKTNSKSLFNKFIKEKGILSFRKERFPEEDDPSADDNREKQTLKHYFSRYLSEFKGQRSRLLLVMFQGLLVNIILPKALK